MGKCAHYHEVLEDGTCFGLFDGSQSVGAISEARFWEYHEQVARQEHPAVRGHIFSPPAAKWPRSAIEHARVRTALISTFRVHPRRYFVGGEQFPESWPSGQIKNTLTERYSPPGTIGYYFGLTVDAALDEAKYYEPNSDLTKNESKIFLVHRTYYHDLLYITPVLSAVWSQLEFPKMDTWEMYLAIMDPRTANEITDRIGLWARAEGFKGIIYPSARYGQRVEGITDTKASVFPALNFVEIGSHLCEQGVAMQMTLNELARTLTSFAEPPRIVFSEPNLVVFDQDVIAGRDRPVFYATYELHDSERIKALEDREGLKAQMKLSYDEEKIIIEVDHPKYSFRAKAPRVVGPEEPVVFSIHHSKTGEPRWVKLRDPEQCAEVISTSEKTLGPDHIDTIANVTAFAWTFELSGEVARAQAMFFRALQSYDRTLGPHDELTKAAQSDFLRCNKKLTEMKQRGEVLEGCKAIAHATVKLDDGAWREANAQHLESNAYVVLLPIDRATPFQLSDISILIEGAQATYVPSEKITLTTTGELCLLAILQ